MARRSGPPRDPAASRTPPRSHPVAVRVEHRARDRHEPRKLELGHDPAAEAQERVDERQLHRVVGVLAPAQLPEAEAEDRPVVPFVEALGVRLVRRDVGTWEWPQRPRSRQSQLRGGDRDGRKQNVRDRLQRHGDRRHGDNRRRDGQRRHSRRRGCGYWCGLSGQSGLRCGGRLPDSSAESACPRCASASDAQSARPALSRGRLRDARACSRGVPPAGRRGDRRRVDGRGRVRCRRCVPEPPCRCPLPARRCRWRRRTSYTRGASGACPHRPGDESDADDRQLDGGLWVSRGGRTYRFVSTCGGDSRLLNCLGNARPKITRSRESERGNFRPDLCRFLLKTCESCTRRFSTDGAPSRVDRKHQKGVR